MTSTLKLTVVSYAGEPRQGMSKRFDVSRATVGRGTDNDWTLPDPEKHLSSRHCIIEQRDNRYVIIDVSKNGVFLNNGEYALGNGSFADLADGDLILIGDYQLQAEIEADPRSQVVAAAGSGGLIGFPPEPDYERFGNPFAVQRPPVSGLPLLSASDASLPPAPAAPGLGRFPLPNMQPAPYEAPQRRPGEPDPNHVSAMDTFFRAPEPQAPLIPPDWNPLAPDAVEAPPAAAPEPAPFRMPIEPATPVAPPPRDIPEAPRQGASADAAALELMRAFLEGAGLSPVQLNARDAAERLRGYGRIFRELVSGIRELLAVRTLTKSEFHIEQTVIRPNDNNPLKFSVDLEQALAALLLPQRSGFGEPLPATREAIADLKSHELSVIAGMQKSVAKLLESLSPDQVERRIEAAGLLASLLPAARKARCWEAYETVYGEVADEFHEDVQSGFRQAFAEAYFDQVKKL
ncbi:MAG TPA: type VI secretion system-associated FHA domain protein TagH [Stellaceae bacterium]|jgi:type VI secretion system FHA domain protein